MNLSRFCSPTPVDSAKLHSVSFAIAITFTLFSVVILSPLSESQSFHNSTRKNRTRNEDISSTSCTLPFEGFGVFLGSVDHFSESAPGTVEKVIEKIYMDLRIRHYRTSYESKFSQSNDTYNISCTSPFTCTWNEVIRTISQYRDKITLFASIWSPPHYMKNILFDTLLEEYEEAYFYFIKNITILIETKYNISIERVSPINEPENVFAPWEHTNMGPSQLCRMVKAFNDPLISLCPENSYYWMSELYTNFTDNATGVDCLSSCQVVATHAYTLNINFFSPYHLLAYYDPGRYARKTDKPIWMTEVSSTFGGSFFYQMQEGLDLAQNIINFLASTCVQRYYFWYAFTRGSSGESLIWGYDIATGKFVLPKKYFVFRHFTLASFGDPKVVSRCNVDIVDDDVSENRENTTELDCIQFGKTNVVLVNRRLTHYAIVGFQCKTSSPFCCTTSEFDWNCDSDSTDHLVLPKRSVCSCEIQTTLAMNEDGVHDLRSNGEIQPLFILANSTIFSNEIPL